MICNSRLCSDRFSAAIDFCVAQVSLVKTPRSRGTFRISNLPNRNISVSPKTYESEQVAEQL
jgi:hypothetical protein